MQQEKKKKKSRFLPRCGWGAKRILVCQNWGRAVMLRESPSQSSQLPVTGEARTSLKKDQICSAWLRKRATVEIFTEQSRGTKPKMRRNSCFCFKNPDNFPDYKVFFPSKPTGSRQAQLPCDTTRIKPTSTRAPGRETRDSCPKNHPCPASNSPTALFFLKLSLLSTPSLKGLEGFALFREPRARESCLNASPRPRRGGSGGFSADLGNVGSSLVPRSPF